jgi:transcriptional regulator with XRE-family HTH domain
LRMAVPQGPYYSALGANIRARRRKEDFTQEQLAAAVGLTRTSITNIEMGRQPVYIHVLAKIAQNLRVSVADFLPDAAALDIAIESQLAGLPRDRKAWVRNVISQEHP